VTHDSERSEAAERLKSFSEKVRETSSISVSEIVEEWDSEGNLNFSFRAMGMKVSGRLENLAYAIRVSGTIPFAALPFRGAIEQEIASKIREALT
jgi:hypothetical protein